MYVTLTYVLLGQLLSFISRVTSTLAAMSAHCVQRTGTSNGIHARAASSLVPSFLFFMVRCSRQCNARAFSADLTRSDR